MEHSSFMFSFDFPFHDDCAEIIVSFGTYHKLFYLRKPPSEKNTYLFIQSTFLNTEKRIFPLFYEYYSKFSVQKQYVYYNGNLTDRLRNYFKKFPNVVLIEWNFQLSHEPYEADVYAHAKPGYMQHMLFKYAKQMSTYFLMTEMDEYIDVYGMNIVDILNRKQYDCIVFEYQEADTVESSFVSTFPSTFYVGTMKEYPSNSRCILKSSAIETMTFSQPLLFNTTGPYICPIYFKLYQFFRWSGKYRVLRDPQLITLSHYNQIDVSQFLKKFNDVRFLYIPTEGTNSHCCIAKGLFEIVQKTNLHIKLGNIEEKYSQRFILCTGGYSLLQSETKMREFIERNLYAQNVFILLPQSIEDIDETIVKFHQNVFIICRDKVSYDYCRQRCFFKENIMLAHDLAFSISDIEKYKERGFGTLYAFQTKYPPKNFKIPPNNVDISSIFLKPNNTSTPSIITEAYELMRNVVSDYETIYTNSLHVAILGARLGKEVHFYSSYSSKNKNVYEYSLKDKYPNVKFIE